MKITCLCASYNRPKLLGQALAMFQAQDYPAQEMLILEDSGIFGDRELSGPGWRMICTTQRMPSVAAKRNYMVRELVASELVAVFDDDDWYFPWHLSAAVAALAKSDWAQPRQALEWESLGVLSRHWVFGEPIRRQLKGGRDPCTPRHQLDCCYGAQWSYRRDAYLAVGGHQEGHGNGEDTEWAVAMFKRFGPSQDTLTEQHPLPSYVYSRAASGSWHGSEMGPGLAYMTKIGAMPKDDPARFQIELPEGYCELAKQIPDEVRARKW